MPRFFSFLLAFFLALPAVMAQRTFSSAKPDSTRNTKEPALIITESNADDFFRTKTKRAAISTSIKLNPLLILNGDMPIYVERKLNDRFSVEVSAGMTYKNYIDEFKENTSMGADLTRTNTMGYSLSAGLRYYPSDNFDALEGYYFAPELRHRVYNTTVTGFNDVETEEAIQQKKSFTDMKLTFGFVNFFEDRIFLDYYIGIGLRSTNAINALKDPETVYTDAGEVVYFDIENTKSKTPIFSLGFKVGFAF